MCDRIYVSTEVVITLHVYSICYTAFWPLMTQPHSFLFLLFLLHVATVHYMHFAGVYVHWEEGTANRTLLKQATFSSPTQQSQQGFNSGNIHYPLLLIHLLLIHHPLFITAFITLLTNASPQLKKIKKKKTSIARLHHRVITSDFCLFLHSVTLRLIFPISWGIGDFINIWI